LIRETRTTPTQKPASRTGIIQHVVPLRVNHADSSRILARLTRGQHVTILASGRRWAHIQLHNGSKKLEGWVRKKYVRSQDTR